MCKIPTSGGSVESGKNEIRRKIYGCKILSSANQNAKKRRLILIAPALVHFYVSRLATMPGVTNFMVDVEVDPKHKRSFEHLVTTPTITTH